MTKHIQLWKNGPESLRMGIGTWAWGDNMVWGYNQKNYTDEDLELAFDASIKAGITMFDTAEVYGSGKSENILGGFIKKVKHPLIIASKFMPYPWRLGKNSVMNAAKNSLKRLGLENMDLYQIHWPFPPRPIEHWVEQMAGGYQAGLIKGIGVSNFSIEQTRRAHTVLQKYDIPLAVNQIEYSLVNRKPEKNGLLQVCKELDVKVIAYSPLGQGLLTGKYTPDNPPPGFRGRRTNRKQLDALIAFNKLQTKIGENHGGKTPSQVAVNWTIQKDTFPIPGVKNLRQTEENLGALGWDLTQDEVAELDFEGQKII
mgnify:FL=1